MCDLLNTKEQDSAHLTAQLVDLGGVLLHDFGHPGLANGRAGIPAIENLGDFAASAP